jgi:methyl-accepting chemotaxis protein
MLLNNLSVKVKLFIIGSLGLLGALAVQGLLLHMERNHLIDSHKVELRHLTEVVTDILSVYQSQEATLGKQEAQKRAEAALEKLRYEGGEGYFWINDFQPKMIMHPTSPDLVGKDLSDFKDVNGRYIFKEIVQIVENKGAGYLEYHWKQPGGKENADKISYVSEFKPWHWIIGTGTYLDDVDKRFWQGVEASLIPLLVIYSIIGILVQLISVSIKRPLSSLVKEFNQVAEGDLSNPMKLQNRGDEFGLLSQAAAAMIENFRRFISLNHEGANNLEMTEQALSESSSVTVAGMQQQHVETDTLATAIEEMAATVAELARNASETSELKITRSDKLRQASSKWTGLACWRIRWQRILKMPVR